MTEYLIERWSFVCARLASLPGVGGYEHAGLEVVRLASTSLEILELVDRAYQRTNPVDFTELGRRLLARDADGFTRLLTFAESALAAHDWLQGRLRAAVAAREN